MKLKSDERSKEIKDYEGLYSITSMGRVWSHRRKIWLKPGIDANGYHHVSLSVYNKASTHKIHTMVGKAFVPNPDNKPQINHKNGDKNDCRAINLEWVTARENLQHACDLGLNKCFKLSYEDKVLACRLYSDHKIKQNRIASMLGVSPPAINYVIRTYTPLIATNHSF